MCTKLVLTPDTVGRNKTLDFIMRILPKCAPKREYEDYIAVQLNMALLCALAEAKQTSKNLLIQTLAEIFTWYTKMNSQQLVGVYQQLPNFDQANWKLLVNNHTRTIKTKKGDKKFR
eukprot:CAMPEP_0117438064 /NCGR_PEP_ID=MMETSP0759-20121206/1858_1 /TAXON_ID=63605 /ORGANISM="Percolomonas cosmopolitus, Strain WS" /LENGTH=116 /DNA_ID=CAMNT_0005229739 /DNA_START=510 /DNA_END=857 /DNA_ORIENTATION=+